jgi:nitrite reductase (NADH) large subunit
VAAHNLTGGSALYEGSVAATHLKVVGLPVFSVGETGDDENPLEHRFLTYIRASEGIYRKLILRNRRLVGAVAIGEWSELAALQEAVTHRRRLGLAAVLRFRRSGHLWAEAGKDGVAFWPATAMVCNCASVSRGRLTDAVAGGCCTIECLGDETGAGRVCGSCRPLLAALVGAQARPAVAPGRAALLGATLATLLLLLAFYWPGPMAPASSAQKGEWPQRLWTDGVWKQVSGYSLLGLGVIGLALSLRKRWTRFSFGDYGWWRVAHVALGLAALTVLIAHTGLHAGQNLNFYLLVSFLALTKVGSLASTVVALEARPSRASRRLKAFTTWAHILLVWPLPALLAFHILSVYYF